MEAFRVGVIAEVVGTGSAAVVCGRVVTGRGLSVVIGLTVVGPVAVL